MGILADISGLIRTGPTPPRGLALVAALVLIAGAAYCMGYEELTSGRGNWPASLLWSLYGVMPWLFVFEAIKRWEWRRARNLAPSALALVIVGTALASITAEFFADWLDGLRSAPGSLQAMRRLPAVGALFLLLLVVRRGQIAAAKRPDPDALSKLRLHAGETLWIAAADNYLELHRTDSVVTLRLTMRQAQSVLETLGFVRIHRSYLVNHAFVVKRIASNGSTALELVDGRRLPTGKAYQANLAMFG